FNAPPLWWRAAYGLAFALFSAAMAFAEPASFLRFSKSPLRLLDAMRPSAYGIFLVHYIFIIWLQYAAYHPPLSACFNFWVVSTGRLSVSGGMFVLLRKVQVVSGMFGAPFLRGGWDSIDPGFSSFRVCSFGPPRNDKSASGSKTTFSPRQFNS